MVSHDLSSLRHCKSCLLTPNANEFRILLEAAVVQTSSTPMRAQLQSENKDEQLRGLAAACGAAVLLKGEVDILALPDGEVIKITAPDLSPRRCGGQGDILAGCLGVALHWANIEKNTDGMDKDAFI